VGDVVSELVVVILALSAGVAGGLWTPILAWLATTEPFNARKFLQGFMTCLAAGFGFSLLALQSPPTDGPISLTVFWLTTFLACIGVDYTRNKIGGMTRAGGEGEGKAGVAGSGSG
jgi:hypothetical protein